MKKRRKTFSFQGIRFDLIPFEKSLETGYVRIEKDGEYIGFIDETLRIQHLKSLRDALNQFIKRKSK